MRSSWQDQRTRPSVRACTDKDRHLGRYARGRRRSMGCADGDLAPPPDPPHGCAALVSGRLDRLPRGARIRIPALDRLWDLARQSVHRGPQFRGRDRRGRDDGRRLGPPARSEDRMTVSRHRTPASRSGCRPDRGTTPRGRSGASRSHRPSSASRIPRRPRLDVSGRPPPHRSR